MNPISNTAWYCCGVRMDDAERRPSVCNDRYARRFMNEHGLRIYEPFRTETMPNISNIVRCRIIDELIQRELDRHADTRVVTIGAGFDSRPYRLRGGDWYEIDEPQIIEYKNERLPLSACPNPLRRLTVDFGSQSFAEPLREVHPDRHTVAVIEGVFMYLGPDAIADTLRALHERFSRHVLLCDLMNRAFFEKFAGSVHAKIVAIGARFTARPEDPAKIFIEHGYKQTAEVPMLRRAMELGVLWHRARIPRFVARVMLSVLQDLNGFSVRRFVYEPTGGR